MHLVGNALFTLVALFSVMGIPSLPPVFLAVTEGMDSHGRRKIALQSALAIGITMLVSFAIGQYILELFGIDIEAFRVAGALVVASMAWGMITGKPSAILSSNGSSPAILGVTILALLFMVGAGFLERTLGETGLNIVSRIFGLLLLAIAITSIMESLLAYFPGWGAAPG